MSTKIKISIFLFAFNRYDSDITFNVKYLMNTNLKNVLSAIDEINSQDANITLFNGKEYPKELIYGQRMTSTLSKHWPQASELLQIAVRAQHIKRWHLKRNEFEQGKAGYYKWRIALGKFHGELAAKIMIEHGYSESLAEQTASIICKENLKDKKSSQLNSDSQTLEDVACLVFLEHYFDEFAAKYLEQDNEAKIIRIVQLTWKKMSQDAHEIALTLTLPDHLSALVQKALA